jgi:pimeloyl-ACP methyl ester carboxylesterase
MTFVLVHGLGVSHRYFERLHERLADSTAPDLAGSSVEELASSLALAAPSRATFVGSSLGCQIAVELAVREPERVERLVLIGPTGYHHPLATYASRLAVDWIREPPSLVLIATADYYRWGPRRLLRTARSMRRDPFTDKLPRIAVPALVVRGAGDPMCTQPWAEHVVSLLPRGRLAVVPGGAHAVQWSHADDVARLIEEAEHDSREG